MLEYFCLVSCFEFLACFHMLLFEDIDYIFSQFVKVLENQIESLRLKPTTSEMCLSTVEFILRLSFLRYFVATVTINLELYWYIHQKDRTVGQNLVLLCFIIAIIIAVPLYIIIIIDDVLVTLFLRFLNLFQPNKTTKSAKNSDENNVDTSTNSSTRTLRVMCFNIQNGAGMDGKIDMNRTCKIITDEETSILCLQEVEKHSKLYSGNQTQDIASKIEMDYSHEIDVRPQYWDGIYGDSIISKYPISETMNYNFPHWKFRNPRKVIAVKVNIGSIAGSIYNSASASSRSEVTTQTSTHSSSSVAVSLGNMDKRGSEIATDTNSTHFQSVDGAYIWVVNTHLQNDPTFDENWYQVKHLLSLCDKIVENSIKDDDFYGLILCGDFNLPAISSPIQYLKLNMLDCVTGATFPSEKPIAQIDHIFLHKQSKLKIIKTKSRVIENGIASDHRPLVAEFSY